MSEVPSTQAQAVTKQFLEEARQTILNPYSTDMQISNLLQSYLSQEGFSEIAITGFNAFLNMRSQRATALSNIEDKKHNTATSIIANLK
jgi:hypothetical protein